MEQYIIKGGSPLVGEVEIGGAKNAALAILAAAIMTDETVTFNDTLRYIDELIIDVLALESTLEGNRFGDLVRFAERYNEPELLAKRVAARKGEENIDAELEAKLMDKSNWYLPFK